MNKIAVLAPVLLAVSKKIDPSEVALKGTDINTTLINIFNIVYFMAGAVAVLVIVIAGFMLAASSGDSNRVANARKMIFGAVIGLVVVVMAASITYFVTKNIR